MKDRRQSSTSAVGLVLVVVAVTLVGAQQLLSDLSSGERAAQLGFMIAVLAAAGSRSGASCMSVRRADGAARRR